MKPRNEYKTISYEEARVERENKRICIIACVILAICSLLMYIHTNRLIWGLILVASVCAGLYLLSRLAELDDILQEEKQVSINNNTSTTYSHNHNQTSVSSHNQVVESKEIIDDEYYYDEDGELDLTDEESRRHFNINMPLFKKEAKEKYANLVKEMGMTPDCVGNGVMDVWSNVDGIFGINKWEFFDKEISRFGGKYTDMIIQGNSGRCVDFCELRIPISDLEKLGLSQYTVGEMVDFNDKLKQRIEDDITGKNRHRRATDKKPATTDDQLAEIVRLINDLINEKNKKKS